MGREDLGIRALEAAAANVPGHAAVYRHLRGDARKARDLGPEVTLAGFQGSWNIPVVNRAASYGARIEEGHDRRWLMVRLEGELDGDLGLCGTELGSRVYSPFVVAAWTMVLGWSIVRSDWKLARLAERWVHSFWTLARVASSPRTNPAVAAWSRAPFCALVGQRTPHYFWDDSALDTLLAMATTTGWPMRGAQGERRFARRSWLWPVRMLAGRHLAAPARFNLADWSSSVRVPTTVARWEDGSVACWQERAVNGNKAPTLGVVFDVESGRPPTWLHPHKRWAIPGIKIQKRILPTEGPGRCLVIGDRLVAWTRVAKVSAPLPKGRPVSVVQFRGRAVDELDEMPRAETLADLSLRT